MVVYVEDLVYLVTWIGTIYATYPTASAENQKLNTAKTG